MPELLQMAFMKKTNYNKYSKTDWKEAPWKEQTDHYKDHATENDLLPPIILYIIAHIFVK